MMKMRNFVASIAACAVAASAMALTVGAQVTNGNTTGDDGSLFYMYDVLAEGGDVTAIYGVKVEMTVGDLTNGCGGGFGFNSESTGWKSIEWGNADAGKALSFDENGDFTYTSDAPIFATSDTYCQIWLQNWWGCDVTVDNITLLGADGNALTAGGAEEETPEETTPAADDDADTTTTAAAEDNDDAATTTTTKAAASTGSTNTGDAGVGLALAGLAVAGAVAFVTKRK